MAKKKASNKKVVVEGNKKKEKSSKIVASKAAKILRNSKNAKAEKKIPPKGTNSTGPRKK